MPHSPNRSLNGTQDYYNSEDLRKSSNQDDTQDCFDIDDYLKPVSQGNNNNVDENKPGVLNSRKVNNGVSMNAANPERSSSRNITYSSSVQPPPKTNESVSSGLKMGRFTEWNNPADSALDLTSGRRSKSQQNTGAYNRDFDFDVDLNASNHSIRKSYPGNSGHVFVKSQMSDLDLL